VTRLDQLLFDMREQGQRFSADGPLKSQLQPAFLEDLRFEQRMKHEVMVVQSATLEGWDEPVSYVLANDVERVAVQLVPKGVNKYFKGFEYSVLAGGDVDAVVRFSGQDLFYFGKDCVAVLAHLHPGLYHRSGLWNTANEAEPATRQWEPQQPGWDSIEIPFTNKDGEESIWELSFCWGVRYRRRRSRLARAFQVGRVQVVDQLAELGLAERQHAY
jgi:hypothetical protein